LLFEYFYTDSNGHQEENPRFLKKAEQSIKHAQRRIYKKEKGKNGRSHARKRFAKKHLRVSRQRNEHAKRLARCVVKSNDLVAYEDLSVRNMVKNHPPFAPLNKGGWGDSDAGWTQFRQWVEYNACKFNREAVAVNPRYTSQNCSNCGAIVKKSLSTRTHICKCGCRLNRDENAAINILNLALQARGGHPQSNALRSWSHYASWSNPEASKL
jgi:putative transposase